MDKPALVNLAENPPAFLEQVARILMTHTAPLDREPICRIPVEDVDKIVAAFTMLMQGSSFYHCEDAANNEELPFCRCGDCRSVVSNGIGIAEGLRQIGNCDAMIIGKALTMIMLVRESSDDIKQRAHYAAGARLHSYFTKHAGSQMITSALERQAMFEKARKGGALDG